jgi:hypothetical protein
LPHRAIAAVIVVGKMNGIAELAMRTSMSIARRTPARRTRDHSATLAFASKKATARPVE